MNYSMLELAFIGDAIHTAFIRNYLIKNNQFKLDILHKNASKFCSAKFQSKVLDSIIALLSEEESDIVRRARNTKTKHIAKNACTADYHKATSFEALIGWLYLNNQKERLNEILNLSILKEE